MGVQRFNNTEWNIILAIFNPFLKKYIEIKNECIAKIELYNSLEAFYPVLTFEFTDKYFAHTPYLFSNNGLVNLEIEEPILR